MTDTERQFIQSVHCEVIARHLAAAAYNTDTPLVLWNDLPMAEKNRYRERARFAIGAATAAERKSA